MRLDRIKQAKDEESRIANLNYYLVVHVMELGATEEKSSAVIASVYVVNEDGLSYFFPRSATNPGDRAGLFRLVIPELL